jgi:hypothetical protein
MKNFFPFHLVTPWFILISFSLLNMTTGAVAYFHGYYLIGYFFILLFVIILGMTLWFKDVIKETPLHKNSIYLGVKKAYEVPMLPEKLDKFYNHIFIRILRFIGGLCLLLTLTSKYSVLPAYLHLPIFILGLLQSIQIILIFFTKGIYGIYTLKYKPNKFEVRNSPLNFFATHMARILYCAKVGCVVTGGAATVITAGASFDSVLEAAGREKVFLPMLGSMYKSVFGEILPKTVENRMMDMVKKVEPDSKPDNNIVDTIKHYNSLTPEEKLIFLNEINRNINNK